ncbi:unnamed protein product [Rotaria sp. Silwood1]|nr:unnamed protein product [Rotaria sp. Silwood1]CAF1227067.1 unnamed protein product [Rotaria sp. Silwood1]CAF1254883.1 unnamed protein product [Rotaria sp. Silwood1]CAF3443118.1 unnamed protein product [Rotaria sp. Silwood1]CAF3496448.1 unnamed protein product [Rotaria sp. Silwood1]
MLPLYNIHPKSVSVPTAQILYSSNMANGYTTRAMSNKYYSHMYSQCRNIKRDQSHYCHVPFDWYQPPKQGYSIIHEDVAVVTSNGPVPLHEFNRYYIHCKNIKVCNDNDDSTSFESEEYDDMQESSYEQRSIESQSYTRTESESDDDEENTSSSLNQ